MTDEQDDNPWDEEGGGGRTLAMEGPGFVLPANVPSPITVPPPPAPAPPAPAPAPPAAAAPPAKNPHTSTLVGMLPADFMASLPRPGGGKPPPSAPRPGITRAVTPGSFAAFGAPPPPRPPSARMAAVVPPPVVLADDDLAGLAELPVTPPPHREDGPTRAVSSPLSTRPLRDDASHTGFVLPGTPVNDKDAETMALAGNDPLLPAPPPQHHDAHVIVGDDDAVGEDATLAIGPGQLDYLGRVPGGGAPAYPGTPMQAPPPPAPPTPSWQGEAAQSYRNPPAHPYDPLMPQGPYPSSGHQQVMQGPPQSNPMPWGPPPNAPTYPAQHPQQPMMQQAQQPAVWAPQQPQQPTAPEAGKFQFTPQIMLLVGVGVVCLAIFVIGVVLFVTTKF